MKNVAYFDLRTIYFTSVLAFAACTLVIGLIWHQSRKRFAGMGFLVLDFGMQTAAILLITLRGAAPNWLTIGVAQVLVLSGSILGFMGLERFVGKPTSQFYNACLLVVYSIAFGYFAWGHEAFALRDLVFSMGTLVVWFQCARLMLVRVHPDMRPLTFGVGVIFGAYSFVNVFRIAGFFGQLASEVPFVSSGTVLMLVIPIYQGLFILLTVSVVLMVNKRLLMEIGKEEEKFEKAFHSSSEAVVLASLLDGRITEVNRQFENLSGYAYREAIGRTVEELGLWAGAKERVDALDELAANGFVHDRECRFRTRGGEALTGILQAELLTIHGETFILTSINDITRRKKAEEQLEQLNRSLQERVDEEIEKRLLHERLLVNQSRLASMGKMIGAIAHQWRQPLSTLSMMVQRFYATAGFQRPTREQLDQFKAGAMEVIKHMSDTIEEFRSFHQPEKKMTAYDPCDCIAGAVSLFAPHFRADGITLEVVKNTEKMGGVIFGYPNEFKHVILNLIGNARHAILRRRDFEGDPFIDGRITVRVFPLGKNLLAIDVEDNGCGIPDEIAPCLFDPYFTTKEQEAGTGIGLYMSRGIVESSLKGRIYLVRGDGGATFRIELPLEKTQ